MKKSILSIVAIAFAAVSVLSSCDKNDDGYGQSAKTTTVQSSSNSSASSNSSTGSTTANASQKSYGVEYFISDSMAELGTYTVTVSDGTKSASYDIVAQGKHTSYDMSGGWGRDIQQGYIYKIVQPSEKALKFTVTFTPNDKTKSLTDETVFNGAYDARFITIDGGHQSSMSSGNGLKKVPGTLVVEKVNAAVLKMSKDFNK